MQHQAVIEAGGDQSAVGLQCGFEQVLEVFGVETLADRCRRGRHDTTRLADLGLLRRTGLIEASSIVKNWNPLLENNDGQKSKRSAFRRILAPSNTGLIGVT